MSDFTGVIEEVTKKPVGDSTRWAFKIGGKTFSTFKEDVGKEFENRTGSSVTVDYFDKESQGRIFHNINSMVVLGGDGSALPSSVSSGPSLAATSSSGFISDEKRQRLIVRQNCLTQGNKLMENLVRAGLIKADYVTKEGYQTMVIEWAKKFEEWVME